MEFDTKTELSDRMARRFTAADHLESDSDLGPWLRWSLIPTLFVVVLIAASAAFAQEVDDGEFARGDEGSAPNADSDSVPGLAMGAPTYGGTGCPQGSVGVALNDNGKTLSFLFDQYIARAGGAAGPGRERVECQVRIPFQVPPGYRVKVVKLDYRGFAALPDHSRAVFAAGFRYLGSSGDVAHGPRVMRRAKIQGPAQSEFVLTSVLRGRGWSPCGQSFNLAAESFLQVASRGPAEEALATIDSLDAVQLPVKLSLRWKKCAGDGEEDDGRPKDRPNRGRPDNPGRGRGRG